MIDSFLDFISSIFIKFASSLPTDDIDITDYIVAIRNIWSYCCYFIPVHTIHIVFTAWEFMIGLCVFGFLLVYLIKEAIPMGS